MNQDGVSAIASFAKPLFDSTLSVSISLLIRWRSPSCSAKTETNYDSVSGFAIGCIRTVNPEGWPLTVGFAKSKDSGKLWRHQE